MFSTPLSSCLTWNPKLALCSKFLPILYSTPHKSVSSSLVLPMVITRESPNHVVLLVAPIASNYLRKYSANCFSL
ncbi:hypothetical protein QL285_007804 [Trifolium repens]|nr:hypothetical protein QL285_007804 [Trifolium repens]